MQKGFNLRKDTPYGMYLKENTAAVSTKSRKKSCLNKQSIVNLGKTED